ncbi:hypothetical protein [Pseudofrankia sp. BMG5.37]|uniref:hypothetical protein n=1 Tax=Pseudofrankia sp. BMG5.37 TaxID=3050035 RepID=UPI002895099F|nr:hypothetical protein [Pseudofrankia sp. BMG5.37]MDT3440979.1 hypothetical protein [Pseudofrankia sp. BMG5.37]
MNVETGVSIGAAAIAAFSLYFGHLATRAATRAARAAEEQTEIQRQLRIDAAQPYVWVDVRPDETVGTLLNLIVGNSGPTVALNVTVAVDPPLASIDQMRDRAHAAQVRLAEGISSLAPGRSLTWPLGQGFNLIPESGREAFTFTVKADGPFGTIPEVSYTVDLSDFRGVMHRPTGSLHEITQAIKSIGN